MTKFLSLLSLASLLLVGCNGGVSTSNNDSSSTNTASNAPAKAPSGDFKVALITPGPVNDSGWCALAYDGLQGIKTEMDTSWYSATDTNITNQVCKSQKTFLIRSSFLRRAA